MTTMTICTAVAKERLLIVILTFGLHVLALSCSVAGRNETAKLDVLLDWKPTPSFIGFYVAQDLGYYRDAGLAVTFEHGTGAADSAKIVSAGTYPVGTSSAQATALARAAGSPIRSLAILYPAVPTVMISMADAPIRFPRDIPGKRVGVNAASATFTDYLALLKLHGIDRASVHEVGVGWDMTPLITHRVDAVMDYSEQSPIELRVKGYKIATMAFRDNGLKCYGFNMIANESALQSRGAAIDAFRTATLRGYEFVKRDPEAATRVFLKFYPERERSFVRESVLAVIANLGPDPIGLQTQDGWNETLKTLVSAGVLTQEFAAAEVIAK